MNNNIDDIIKKDTTHNLAPPLENPRCYGTRNRKLSYLLTELLLHDLLLLFAEAQPEDPELIQRSLREINLAKLKTNLLLDICGLLRSERQLNGLIHRM